MSMPKRSRAVGETVCGSPSEGLQGLGIEIAPQRNPHAVPAAFGLSMTLTLASGTVPVAM
jgi:hypothetical protein